MSTPGVDYAWSHPGGAALKAAGKKFACRYLSSDHSKNLTRTEADDLAAHDVASVVVWETTTDRALAGKTGGTADAKTAASQAAAAGMPGDRPIYFAVDFDSTPGQQTAINAYLDGAASVIGRARVGIYGGYYPVKRALDAKKATWAWQTAAWSGGQWDARAHIRQGAQSTIGGVSCDLNTGMVSDFGQWTPGSAPSPDDGFPGASAFGPGANNAHVTQLGTWLCARGGSRFYKVGPGPKWTQAADGAATQAFQKAQGWTGSDADGIPGPTTWSLLAHDQGHDIPAAAPAKPKVSLANLIAAAKRDPGLPQGGTTHPADVKIYEAALRAEGLLPAKYASDGSFGSTTITANSAWQKAYSKAHGLGWSGADVNGIPGRTSATALGAKHGFTVA
ncbi:peptidoglycan-binding protein [Streptomyces tremellae]|uniref:Rv2525c-like glycoside hydrolase-like domain-containing protein n=1 Tax=Streptomyces tremellae TaxID=1124239 RepID=A0ABP7EHT6_9ACTN